MIRVLTTCLAAGICVITLHPVLAQPQIVQKSTPHAPDEFLAWDDWWVSAAFRDDSEPTRLACRCNTLGEARVQAQRWLTQNHRKNLLGSPNRIRSLVIEGEPTIRKRYGPTLPSFDQLVSDAVTLTPELLDTVQNTPAARRPDRKIDLLCFGLARGSEPNQSVNDYVGTLRADYNLAKQLKERVLSLRQDPDEETIQQVNAQVAKFNAHLDTPPEGIEPALLVKFPRMSPVNDVALETARMYRVSVETEMELAAEKSWLDEERQRLRRQQAQLVHGHGLTQHLGNLLNLQRYQARNDWLQGFVANATVGSTRVRMTFRSNGLMDCTIQARDYAGSYQVSGQTITMKMGEATLKGTYSNQRMSGTVTYRDGKSERWEAQMNGSGPDLPALQQQIAERQDELTRLTQSVTQAQASYAEGQEAYLARWNAYQERQRDHEGLVARLDPLSHARTQILELVKAAQPVASR